MTLSGGFPGGVGGDGSTDERWELSRLEVLRDLDQKRLTTAAAGQLLGLERRQVLRLLKAYRAEGATGLISEQCGRRSNRRKPEAVWRAVLTMIRQWYWDFGPTLASDKLAEVHGCTISRETLRGWMIAAGLWIDRRHRLLSLHQPCRRRDCCGELVQIDGSEDAWFEDRAEKCTPLAFVNDATSRLMHLRFVTSASAFDYFRATRSYLETHGKPAALYSDKHSIFRPSETISAAGCHFQLCTADDISTLREHPALSGRCVCRSLISCCR